MARTKRRDLWTSDVPAVWQAALAGYAPAIAAQGVRQLPELDRWYREELPAVIDGRRPAHLTLAELVRVTEWKMSRGVWRARNLMLVRSNDAARVAEVSAAALAAAPHPTAPIAQLAALAGVGPATASAIAAAARPALYPFLDELVAAQVPGIGALAYTVAYYARYADALRARAERLGPSWTPVQVERALWAYTGGKAGPRAPAPGS